MSQKGFAIMKKPKRLLFGTVAVCSCFLFAMLVGSFRNSPDNAAASSSNITKSQANFDLSISQENDTLTQTPAASLNPTLSPTPTVSPTPTLSPTPTASPTPTVSPTPTLSPTPTASPTPTVSPTPTLSPTPTVSPTPAPVAYVPKFTLPAVTTNLNIRSGPGKNHDIIGKLSAGCYALLLEDLNGWTKISTGSIKEGYVSSDYLFSSEEVMSMCDREKWVKAVVTASSLNVRTGPGTWYDSITKVKKNTSYPVYLSKSYQGWIAIELKDGTIGYISEDYVKFSYTMDTGLTLAEIKEKERQDAIAAAMAKAQIFHVERTKRKPMTMTDEELYLFATVIHTESNDQGYEGMLAVANVILNRIETGKWGDTLEDVLFAPGQFAGAAKELIARAQKKGLNPKCYDAAKAALAGDNNIGDFLYFRTTDSAMRASDYLTYDVFYIINDHVFYDKDW